MAAAAVVVLAVGPVVVLSRTHGGTPRAGARPPPVRTIKDVPLIEKPVAAYHGVVIAVPGKLPVLTNACEAPCIVRARRGSERFRVLRVERRRGEEASARPCCSTDQVRQSFAGPIARSSAAIGIRERDRRHGDSHRAEHETVRRILASVKVAPDPNGCPPRLTAPSRRWVAGQTGIQLVRCVYASAGWLQASLPLGSADLVARRIAAIADERRRGSVNGYEHDLLRFSYPDGTTRIPRSSSAARRCLRPAGGSSTMSATASPTSSASSATDAFALGAPPATARPTTLG